MYYLAALTLAQLLLVNFKTYNARYYLFLLPFLGALMADFVWALFGGSRNVLPLRRLITATFLSVLVAMSLLDAAGNASAIVHCGEAELSESVPIARQIKNADSILIARKPVLAFYTGAHLVAIPQGKNIGDLHRFSHELPAPGEIYIYYGGVEQRKRPEYSPLLDPSRITNGFPELSLVGRGSGGGKRPWLLYRYSKNFDAR